MYPAKDFTELEAKSRFETLGYSDVKELHKDSFGVWHATAIKSGKVLKVSLDLQGNVGIQ